MSADSQFAGDPLSDSASHPDDANAGERSGLPSRRRSTIRRLVVVLGVCIAVAANLAIWRCFPPEYEAAATLILDSPDRITPIAMLDAGTRRSLVLTQIRMIVSEPILRNVLVDPIIAALPSFRDSDDPRGELLKRLDVANLPETNLIRISYRSSRPMDSMIIVNAIVDVNYKMRNEVFDEMNAIAGSRSLRLGPGYRDDLEKQLDVLDFRFRKLTEQKIQLERTAVSSKVIDDSQLIDRLSRAKIELIEAESALEPLNGEAAKASQTNQAALESAKLKVEQVKRLIESLLKQLDENQHRAVTESEVDLALMDGKLAELARRRERLLDDLDRFKQWIDAINDPLRSIERATPPITPIRDLRLPMMALATASIAALSFLLCKFLTSPASRTVPSAGHQPI